MNARRLLLALAALAAAFVPAVAGVTALPLLKGAKVWFAEDHTVPMIALTASLPAGSIYDPPGRSGLASLAASLLDRGAGRLDGSAYAAALADRGIKLSVSVNRDVMIVSMVTLSSNAREAFRLLGLALSRPRFDGAAVTLVRQEMLQNIAEDLEDPEQVARKGFFSLYFGPYTYGRPVDGDPRGVQAVTLQDLHAFARTHWVQAGLKVAIAGDTSKTAVAALVKSAFGSLPEAEPAAPPVPMRVGAPGLHVLPMSVEQPVIVFGDPGVPRSDRSYLATLIADYILGGSKTSRLLTELRDKRGLTYDISTELLPYRRAALMLGEVSTRKEDVQQAILALRETLRKFAVDGPTDDELSDAKRYLTGSFPLSFASDGRMAAELNRLQREGLPLDYLSRRTRLINLISADEVRRAAARVFDPKNLTIVVAGAVNEDQDAAEEQ